MAPSIKTKGHDERLPMPALFDKIAAPDRTRSANRSAHVALFRHTRGLIRLALLASLVLLAVVGMVSYCNTLRMQENDAQVARTQEIRARVSDVFDATAKAQIAARLFLLTGKADDRRDWEDGRQRWEREGKRLRDLASGDPDDARTADRFVRLTGLRIAELRFYVEGRGHQKETADELPPDELKRLLRGETESLENLNVAARRFRAEEEARLPPRYAAADATARQTQFTIFLGVFVAVLVVVGAVVLIDRDMEQRIRVEAGRREAEDAVRDSEARLRDTQRQARLGIWENDFVNGKLRWSEEVSRLYGFDKDRETAPTYADFLVRVHPDTREETVARVAQAKATPGSAFEYDQKILLPDGTVRYSRSTMQAVADPRTREVVRLVGTTLDITARVEAEEARERLLADLRESEARLRETADELRRSNRDLGAFAAVASHDLQEPLRKIRTFAERIVQRTDGTLDPTTNDYLRRLQSAGARMQSLIESLLALSQVSTRPRSLEPVDLNRTLAEVVSDLEGRLESTGGRVEVCGGVGTLPIVMGDPTPLRQLLQNLIGNALKFRRPETPSVVTVRGEVVRANEAESVRLTVSDNGIGFAPADAERIFAPFERLEGRDRYDGNGVGLAICQRIVERHGGTITAHGIPGEGAVFTVLLPGDGENPGRGLERVQ